MRTKDRLRRLEQAIAEKEREAQIAGHRLLTDVETTEAVIVATLQAHACMLGLIGPASAGFWSEYCSAPEPFITAQAEQRQADMAAEQLQANLERLRELTGEHGVAWQERVARLWGQAASRIDGTDRLQHALKLIAPWLKAKVPT